MANNKYDGTVKIHFRSKKLALNASFDNSVTAGVRSPSGKIRSWIAHVVKSSPYETAAEAAERIRLEHSGAEPK